MAMLIVQGTEPQGSVRRVLESNMHPECMLFTSDPFQISDALAQDPQAVLAYADTALASVCTGQGVQFEKAKRVVVLVFAWQPNPDEGADMVQQTAGVTKAKCVLDLAYPEAVDHLRRMVMEV